ncbi:MAG: hypothetical protein U5P10_13910 [Spirochaetia bacterium]|nr:hypothetical protein [Spirochaetia bacterium]
MYKEQPEFTIESLLSRLNKWRFYPKFQLERHFDVILSFILPDLLAQFVRNGNSSLPKEISAECMAKAHIIPEFPLPLRFFKETDHHQAIAVDFALFIPDKELKRIENVLFVELKTDESSARETQNEYMEQLQTSIPQERGNFGGIVSEIIEMILASNNPRKYLYLLHNFSAMGLTKRLGNMFEDFFNNTNRFQKAKFLKSEDTVPDLSHINYSPLLIAPQSVTEKLFSNSASSSLPVLGFNTAKNLIEKIENKTNRKLLSILGEYLDQWNSSPISRIEDEDFFKTLTSKENVT